MAVTVYQVELDKDHKAGFVEGTVSLKEVCYWNSLAIQWNTPRAIQ